jgi:hypothetical protein
MSESTHPSDDDSPSNCLDVEDSWKQVVFLDQLNAMTAGEVYCWEGLNEKGIWLNVLAERRQCIAFNLSRFDTVAESKIDYLSTIADSTEDAQQLWINKTSSGLDGPIGSEDGFGHNRGHSSTNRGHGTRSLEGKLWESHKNHSSGSG